MSAEENEYPDDENGHVLRQMAEAGDDLTKVRDIDFVVVLPSEVAARKLAIHFEMLGYRVMFENAKTVPDLPWDVTVVKRMLPTHKGITDFENELQSVADSLGGRNDGWGCFEQPESIH